MAIKSTPTIDKGVSTVLGRAPRQKTDARVRTASHDILAEASQWLATDGVLVASDVAATPAEPTGDDPAEVANG